MWLWPAAEWGERGNGISRGKRIYDVTGEGGRSAFRPVNVREVSDSENKTVLCMQT